MPQASVASQLLVTVFEQPEPPVTSPSRLTVTPPQASLAVGAVNVGEAVHSTVAFAPGAPIVGGAPTRGIVCETVVERLPQASTAYQLLVIVVVQAFPEVMSGTIAITVAALQASLAVGGVNVGVAVQSIVVLAPAVPIVGGVVSTAIITCVLVAEWLPQASVASHVLV